MLPSPATSLRTTRFVHLRRCQLFALAAVVVLASCIAWIGAPASAIAQSGEPAPPAASEEEQTPEKVDIAPVAADAQIVERLTTIYRATEWFPTISVTVRDGIVTLNGEAVSNTRIKWAGDLARKTESVVAVVNKLKVDPGSAWNFEPAFSEIGRLAREMVRAIPLVLFATAVLALAWFLMGLIRRAIRTPLNRHFGSPLLGGIAANFAAVPIFLLGIYLVLQVAGLTRLALTILGGTGIIGLVVGFAFRDIAENFLASVLLSIRQPFE
ncbi:MAG: mechanosensitive ion channel family protein, partial [Pseudomonadota bacterium]